MVLMVITTNNSTMNIKQIFIMTLLMLSCLTACGNKKQATANDDDFSWTDRYIDASDSTSPEVAAWLQTVSMDSIEHLLCRHNGEVTIGDSTQQIYLSDVLRCRQDAMKYSFKECKDSLGLEIHQSADGRVRVFHWDTYMGGTCPDIARYTLLRGNDGKLHFMNQGHGYPALISLYTMHDAKGNTLYLMHDYFRESSAMGAAWATVYRIEGDTLAEIPVFPRGESSVGLEYTIPDWYFIANNGEGWGWLFEFDGQNLYAPVNGEGMDLIDRYALYHWNGNSFDSVGEVGNRHLHQSLQDYKELAVYFVTSDYRVRVDLMYDGTCRYASWRRDKSTDTKPDIIIPNGRFDEKKCSYVFENDGYTYYAGGVYPGYGEESSWSELLIVMKGNRTVLKQEKVNELLDD